MKIKKTYKRKIFTPLAQQIIELSIKEAKDGKYTYVGACHIQKALNAIKKKHNADLFEM